MCALGAMMLAENAANEVSQILAEEDFYRPTHREIYRACQQVLQNASAVDLVTVRNQLTQRGSLDSIGGVDYLIQLAESVPSAANAKHYAEIVRDMATLRKLEQAGSEIVKISHGPEDTVEEKIDRSEQLLFQVGRQRMGKDFLPVKTIAKEFFKSVDAFRETGQPVLGTASRFIDLDRVTGGFYGGDFIVLAARPSMGKTSLVLSFALNVARANVGNVAFFALEMSGKQLVWRMMSYLSGVGMGALKATSLSDQDYQKLADACDTLYNLPIYIDDTSNISPLEVRGKCRRLMQEGGLSLVVVDYLQLMKGSGRSENRVQEISDIARGLKSLSKELDVPVIALSQLNRSVESREKKIPQLSDIRESGSIEAEADIVMLLYRAEYYKQKEAADDRSHDPNRTEAAEVIIAKHRNGPTGKVILGFQPNYARYTNLAKESIEEYLRRNDTD